MPQNPKTNLTLIYGDSGFKLGIYAALAQDINTCDIKTSVNGLC